MNRKVLPLIVLACSLSLIAQMPAGRGGFNRAAGAAANSVNGNPNSPSTASSKVTGIIDASLLPGGDIGAKISTYFASQSKSAAVMIPPGTYTYSTGMVIPVIAQQTFIVYCPPNSVTLNYTGSGNAVSTTITTSTQNVMSGMIGCTVNGSGSSGSANGVVLSGVYGGYFDNVQVTNFAGGAGWLFQSGLTTCINCRSLGNQYGVELVGVKVLPFGEFAANGVHWIGGRIAHNKQWGWFDNIAAHTASGPSYNNSIEDANFTGNGNCSVDSGQIFLQASHNMEIRGNFFEGQVGPSNIELGVGTRYQTNEVQIDRNHFETPAKVCAGTSVVASINAIFADYTTIQGNEETGAVAAFTNVSSNSRATLMNNKFSRTMVSGTPANTLVIGPGNTVNGTTWGVTAPGAITGTSVTSSGSYFVGGNAVIPSATTGYHGSTGTKVQMSDGTGTSGHAALFDSKGNTTNGPAGYTGRCASTATLTVVNGIITGCN